MLAHHHLERHRAGRVGWLRAAVLGANDGILSTASLVLGVAAAHATHRNIVVAGVAGLVAGAMSMAVGEYVSVHSQKDTEQADLKLERAELKTDDAGEHREPAEIYVARGLGPALAKLVAQQLMAHDALGAHARDELGISAALRARPIQAALASAGSFAVGARDASRGRSHRPAGGADPPCRWNFPVVPGSSGRLGGARWRRSCNAGRNARHLLGRSGNGGDRGHRGAIRNRRNLNLRTAKRFHTLPAGRENLQQLPVCVQILHRAPVNFPVRQCAVGPHSPCSATCRFGPALAVMHREGAKRCFGQFV
jgi:hypothetical protein